MRKRAFRAAAVFAAFSVLVSLPALAAEKVWTLEECLALALGQHPDLRASQSEIDRQAAVISEVQAGGRLQASFSGSYTRSGTTSRSNPDGSDWDSGLALEQSLSDWGRRGISTKSERQIQQAVDEDYRETRNAVIAGVREAYYSVNKAQRDLEVWEEQVENYQRRLDWARSFYEVGTKAKIEVTRAEVDLSNARLSLVKARSALAQSKAALAAAVGSPEMDFENLEDQLDFQAWDISLNEALATAAEQRPDLAAQEHRVSASSYDVALAQRGMAPDLKGSVGYNLTGSSPFSDDQWRARITLSIPLSDGGATKAQTRQAEASLAGAQAQLDSLRQQAVLEVRRAWEALTEAAASLETARAVERQAQETFELAQGRYRAGVGDSLEISDAVDELASAQTQVIESLYQHQAARLQLEQAMGTV